MALFSNSTKKFLSALKSQEKVDWKKLVSLSEYEIRSDNRDRETGKPVLLLLVEAACKGTNSSIFTDLEAIFSNIGRKGGDLNFPLNDKGETALLVASSLNCPTVIGALLSGGASAVCSDNNGITPLHQAIRNGSIATAIALLDAGADMNAEDIDGSTPLLVAASYSGNKEVIELMLAKGALAFTRNKKGETAQSISIKNGFTEYIPAIEDALKIARSTRNVEWLCPECGSKMERPASKQIEWYISKGTWEQMTFVCGYCGNTAFGVKLDGE